PSRGEQVIHNDHALPAADGVFVDLQGVIAIFKLVSPFHGFSGQLAGLADGDEAGVQPVGQGGAKDETTCFNGQHGINLVVQVVLGERINERGETDLVFEQ